MYVVLLDTSEKACFFSAGFWIRLLSAGGDLVLSLAHAVAEQGIEVGQGTAYRRLPRSCNVENETVFALTEWQQEIGVEFP